MSDVTVECVPNFSEGTDERIVREIVQSMKVQGVSLLDWSMDKDHNRSVVTIAGPPEAVAESAIRGVGRAVELIDLTKQAGTHPRVGAADVVPFIPLQGATLGQCAKLAHFAGTEIWRRFGLPVYFYAAAALRPDRTRLEDVRRGQFEGLREAVRADPLRCPDIGSCELHPTGGASLLGARNYLVAYNIFLTTADLHAARSIAKRVRESNGGLPGVKALGMLVDGRAQVSMNVTDLRAVSVADVHAAVQRLAADNGVDTAEGELIGLVPEVACLSLDGDQTLQEWARQIPAFRVEDRVLEQRMTRPMAWPGDEPSQAEPSTTKEARQ